MIPVLFFKLYVSIVILTSTGYFLDGLFFYRMVAWHFSVLFFLSSLPGEWATTNWLVYLNCKVVAARRQ
jgi:hypothetical protein